MKPDYRIKALEDELASLRQEINRIKNGPRIHTWVKIQPKKDIMDEAMAELDSMTASGNRIDFVFDNFVVLSRPK